jgi:hypothetical protein
MSVHPTLVEMAQHVWMASTLTHAIALLVLQDKIAQRTSMIVHPTLVKMAQHVWMASTRILAIVLLVSLVKTAQ